MRVHSIGLPLMDNLCPRDKRWIHKTVSRDVSCEMTTRHTSLAAASVVAQELDGVALDAVHLIAEVAQSMDL